MIKGMGIDTIELDRIARVFAEYKDRFLDRVYAPEEKAYALKFADPVPRLAARFAAKEACMKALGTGWNLGVRWKDIVVINNAMGKPDLTLRGEAGEVLKKLPADRIYLSLTHSKTHATAIVIFE
jgi:holo-[acyl-carrier protein] synthase